MSAATSPRVYLWDEHTPEAKLTSPRWAATRRGWLLRDGNVIGHYIDYAPLGEHYRAQPEGAVHAAVCGLGSRFWKTVEEAKRFVEETCEVVGAPVPSNLPGAKVTRGRK